jgi:hypothetical protein
MKTLKQLKNQITSNRDKSLDPPNILIMRKKSIRQYPNDQRVALYFVDKINKYITVPYTSYQWSSSGPPVEEELENDNDKYIND